MAPKVAKSQAKDKAKGKDKAKDQAKGKAKAQAGQKLPGPGPGGMEENLATVQTAEIELRTGEQDNANLPIHREARLSMVVDPRPRLVSGHPGCPAHRHQWGCRSVWDTNAF